MPRKPGPPPKRSTQRRRRNSSSDEVERVSVPDEIRGPKLTNARQHTAVARRFWESLRESGQAEFYEASDWAAAELLTFAIDSYVKRPSGRMLRAISAGMGGLLVTEADRRRVRLELERKRHTEGEDGDVSEIEEYRRRLGRRPGSPA